MFAFDLRKIFVFSLVIGGLMVPYPGLYGVLEVPDQGPIEGAGSLAAAGDRGVNGAPEVPEAEQGKNIPDRTMTASYYGYALAGNPTASGEPFDPEAHTAAHKSLPLGTELLVKRGGASVRVTINDRGPYVAGRELDLSVGAAREIGLTGPGEDQVQVVLL